MQDKPEITQQKREELLAKLDALLSKTVERGATEGEAKLAAEKAQELMDRYGLSLADIKAAENSDCATETIYAGRKHTHEALWTWEGLEKFCNVILWQQHQSHYNRETRKVENQVSLKFFGLPNDVSVAVFLYRTFQNAMDYEWRKYWDQTSGFHDQSIRIVRKSFMRGMARRLKDRLLELVAQREKDAQAGNDCRAIVVAKQALVKRAFDALNMKITVRKSRAQQWSNSAFGAGQAAGNSVSFHKNIGGGSHLLN